MKFKEIKRGVFTVEAAVIVPLTALILISLIAYIYFMHESVWSRAAAYEAGFYAVQNEENSRSAQEMARERLEERYKESVMGFSENNAEISDAGSKIQIRWRYGILRDLFGDMFTVDEEISISKVDPVTAKRFMWLADYMLNSGQ